MLTPVQQVLVQYLTQTQLRCGSNPGLELAIQTIQNPPAPSSGPISLGASRDPDHLALAVTARALRDLGPFACSSRASALASEAGIYRSIGSLNSKVSLIRLQDFTWPNMRPIDGALMHYGIAQALLPTFEWMEEKKRLKFLQAASLFVYESARHYVAAARGFDGNRDLEPEIGFEAVGDVVLDNSFILRSTHAALADKKIDKSPIEPSVTVVHYIALKALEEAQTIYLGRMKAQPEAAINLAEISAKGLRIEDEIRQREKDARPFRSLDHKQHVERVFEGKSFLKRPQT